MELHATTTNRPAWTTACESCAGAGGHMSCGHYHPCEREGCVAGVRVALTPRGAAVGALADRLREVAADDCTTVVPALTDEQRTDVVVAAAALDGLRAQLARVEIELAPHKAALKAEHNLREVMSAHAVDARDALVDHREALRVAS